MDGSRPVLGDVRCPFNTAESRARTFLPHAPCEVLRLKKCTPAGCRQTWRRNCLLPPARDSFLKLFAQLFAEKGDAENKQDGTANLAEDAVDKEEAPVEEEAVAPVEEEAPVEDEVLAPPAAQCNWSWSATREPASISSSGVADGRWAARAAGSGSMPTPNHTRPAGLFSPPSDGLASPPPGCGTPPPGCGTPPPGCGMHTPPPGCGTPPPGCDAPRQHSPRTPRSPCQHLDDSNKKTLQDELGEYW